MVLNRSHLLAAAEFEVEQTAEPAGCYTCHSVRQLWVVPALVVAGDSASLVQVHDSVEYALGEGALVSTHRHCGSSWMSFLIPTSRYAAN